MKKSFLLLLLPLVAFAAEPEITFSFTFPRGNDAWGGGFSDYPVQAEFAYELAWGWENLPVSEQKNGKGLRLSGMNRSDDLFMFAKREVTDLKPLTRYDVRFKATLITNAPRGCVGVGGAPGENVYFKAGVSLFEPQAILDLNHHYRMNIDKGNQGTGGSQAIVLGDIANTQTDCHHFKYEVKRFDSESIPFTVTTDQTGNVWIFVGTDSGFESKTTVYLEKLEVMFSEVPTPISKALQ